LWGQLTILEVVSDSCLGSGRELGHYGNPLKPSRIYSREI